MQNLPSALIDRVQRHFRLLPPDLSASLLMLLAMFVFTATGVLVRMALLAAAVVVVVAMLLVVVHELIGIPAPWPTRCRSLVALISCCLLRKGELTCCWRS